jgi:hypothetical protein
VRGVPGRRMLFADLLEPSAVDQSGSRRKVGTLPSVLELLDIKDDAEASFLLSQTEAHWNSMVHGTLLSKGLRHSSSYRSAVTGGKAPPSIRVHTTYVPYTCQNPFPTLPVQGLLTENLAI